MRKRLIGRANSTTLSDAWVLETEEGDELRYSQLFFINNKAEVP